MVSVMPKLTSVCNYIIRKCNDLDIYINKIKLQNLIYYCQSWSLAHNRGKLFSEHFEAWTRGPVIKSIYNIFKEKPMYEKITIHDIENIHLKYFLTEDDKQLIDAVILHYGKFTEDQLEALVCMEEPWRRARNCKNHISEEIMERYYKYILKSYYDDAS